MEQFWDKVIEMVTTYGGKVILAIVVLIVGRFVIKFLMAFLMGIFIEKVGADRHVTNEGYRITWVDLLGMLVGGMEMVAGYLVAERFIYGNWATAVIGVPWNIGQFVVGGALAVIIAGGGVLHLIIQKKNEK